MEDRIYKFRGKDIFTGLWRFGDLTHNKGISQEPEKDLYDRVMVGGYEVYKNTVCQFTGLKDKNKKDIYEHDKLREISTGRIVIIEWCGIDHGYRYADNDFLYCFPNHTENFEIIGNFFDDIVPLTSGKR